MQDYCAKNIITDAVIIMDEMSDHGIEPTEITYSVIIDTLCKSGKPAEAVSLLHEMLGNTIRRFAEI